MSRRIIVSESTPKKLDPSPNSTRAVRRSSTAPAGWEEVYHPCGFAFWFTHTQKCTCTTFLPAARQSAARWTSNASLLLWII